MGVYLNIPDYQEGLDKYRDSIVFLNDLHPLHDLDLIQKLFVTFYDSPTFSSIPSCSCGETTLKKYPHLSEGDRCSKCKTKISKQTSRDITSNVWIRPIDGVDVLISPYFLNLLLCTYKEGNSKSTIIHWLLDPYYKLYTNDKAIAYMEEQGVERGINYFYRNAEYVMQLLTEGSVFSYHKPEKKQLWYLFKRYHEEGKVFVQALPLVHKSFNVIEKSHMGSYVDLKSFTPYMNTINTMMSINQKETRASDSRKQSVVANVLFGLVDYYYAYITNNHNKKKGEYRQSVYASRMPWSARMLITSIHDPHDYDEIHYPWSASVGLYEIHLYNLLINRKGYTPNEAMRKILHAISNYDEEIDELFDYMIKTSPHRTTISGKPGLMIIENRNPSLKTGSMQSLLITKIKKDPSDITKSLSVLVLSPLHADFDGRVSHCRH